MKKVTISQLDKLKQQGQKFAVLTAYDASFASVISDAGVECILVGDSLGMVIQGHDSTVPVAMSDMCYHTSSVARGNKQALIIADMPYMSYATSEQAFTNAAALMQAGAQMVKLEGGQWLLETIRLLSERGVPVCAHLGLTPQSVDAIGGFKVQGRSAEQAKQILEDAQALEKAGARLLVLECVPKKLAKQITDALVIPVIGIGAGNETDAQVLVLQDMLGMNSEYFKPKFVKNFMQDADSIKQAIENYASQVRSGEFPSDEHAFLE